MQDQAGLLRHSIRGTINALKLGVSAMDTDLSEAEAIEFLDYIIQATDKMGTLLDQYELEPVFLPPHSQGIATTTAS